MAILHQKIFTMKNKSYTELSKLKTFEERFKYLKINDATIGQSTFGYDRYINQAFYKSKEWKRVRDKVIIRDNANDLGIDNELIGSSIVVHHINPVTLEDLENGNPKVFDLDNLICCSKKTHNAIHYGDSDYPNAIKEVERKPQDNFPWRIKKEVI